MYVTVEPTEKVRTLLHGRLLNYAACFALLFLSKFFELEVPDFLYLIFAGAAAGIEFTQWYNALKHK